MPHSPSPRHTPVFEAVAEHLAARLASAEHGLLVGIGGPGGCGKSTLARWLRQRLPESGLLSLDDFRLPRHQRPAHAPFGSHPEAMDLPAVMACFDAFRAGHPLRQPIFDPAAGAATRHEEWEAPRLLLADGEIAAHTALRPRFDLLVLVRAPWTHQLRARLGRDRRERGSDFKKALRIFWHSNLRDYPRFAQGAEEAAHLRIDHGRDGKPRLTVKSQ